MLDKLTNIAKHITECDLLAIEEICKKLPENPIVVEVGTFYGASAIAWSEFSTDAKIYTIDPCTLNEIENKSKFDLEPFYNEGFTDDDLIPQEEKILENLKDHNNITFIKARSPYLEWNTMVDLVFIDAIHNDETLLTENLVFWDNYLKPGGHMVFHDYYETEFPIVVKVVKKAADMYDCEIKLLAYSMAVLHKPE